MAYLAKALIGTGDGALRDACTCGFDYMLAQQYDHGGFPQRMLGSKGIGARITLNDGVMIGVLGVLKDAADNAPHFAWLDDPRRKHAENAVRPGLACLLRCQIRVRDTLMGWCQQHDEKTSEAVGARTFALASICPGDTEL